MANIIASDNPFPSILIAEATEPAAPAAGHQRLYVDSATHLLMITNSSGTQTPVGGSASGSITASGYTQTTARLLGRTTASTGAIEEITVGSGLSLSAGALTASGGSAPSHSSVDSAADVNITAASTWTDCLSLTLGSGNWMVWATIAFDYSNNTATWMLCRLVDASVAVFGGNGQYSGNAAKFDQMSCLGNVAGSQTIKLQGWVDTNTGSPKAIMKQKDGYSANIITRMHAIQIA